MKLSLFVKATLTLGLPLLLLLGVSCEKPLPEPDAVPLPAELKVYVLFQPGTHWVYQDSATRQLDSVWVVSTEMREYRRGVRGRTYPDMKHEDFRLRTRSNRGGPDQVYAVQRFCALPIRDDGDARRPCWSVTRGESLPNSTADEGGVQVFPYAIPRARAPVGYLYGTMQAYWHSRPLTLGDRTYPDVMEVWLLADASEGGWPARYYWASNLGIVRQRVTVRGVPHTRTLLRSRIVQ